MKIEVFRLSNGIRVVSVPLKERKSVSIGVWVHVGGRDEEPRLSGVSHFLEHLVFKGTKKRTANQIKESVEGIGGSLNAFTSEEYTCFLAKTASKHFKQVFDVLSDMVLNASLKEEDIKKERTVIMEEIKMTQDQPSQLVDELLTELLWAGHALGRPIAGTVETVGALTTEDIHKYRNSYYEPALITVVAAGDISKNKLVGLTRAHYDSIKPKNGKRLQLFVKNGRAQKLKLVSKDTEQTHLAIGMHTFSKEDPDEYCLEILSVILGGNMSSRLFNEVREERGLAYEIGSFTKKYHETGAFGVEAGVDTKKSLEALRVIMKELARTTHELVGTGELRRAKDFFLGQMELGLESTMNNMLWAGENMVSLGRCRTPEEVTDRVEKVTAEDLTRVAKKIFSGGSLNLAVVGPKASSLEADFQEILSSAGR